MDNPIENLDLDLDINEMIKNALCAAMSSIQIGMRERFEFQQAFIKQQDSDNPINDVEQFRKVYEKRKAEPFGDDFYNEMVEVVEKNTPSKKGRKPKAKKSESKENIFGESKTPSPAASDNESVDSGDDVGPQTVEIEDIKDDYVPKPNSFTPNVNIAYDGSTYNKLGKNDATARTHHLIKDNSVITKGEKEALSKIPITDEFVKMLDKKAINNIYPIFIEDGKGNVVFAGIKADDALNALKRLGGLTNNDVFVMNISPGGLGKYVQKKLGSGQKLLNDIKAKASKQASLPVMSGKNLDVYYAYVKAAPKQLIKEFVDAAKK